MTQALLIDEAWAQIPPPVVKAHGYIGVIGYVSRDAPKCLTRARAQQYLDDGLGVRYVFEDTAQRALGGYNAGFADGQFCLSYLGAVGLPHGKPVGFAVDFPPTAAQMPSVLEYARGFRAGLGGYYEAYAYGDADVVDAMTAAGVPGDWQACAWSHGEVDGKATLYQRLRPTTGMTGPFDEDVVLGDVSALGLWMKGDSPVPVAAPPKPAPTPPPPTPAVTTSGVSSMCVIVNTDNGRQYLAGVGVVQWLETGEQAARWLAICGQTSPMPVTTVDLADFAHTNPREPQ